MRRKRLTVAQVREVWRLWKRGATLAAIGEAISAPWYMGYRLVVRSGGIAPRERTRHVRTLSLAEREEISRGLASKASVRCLARRLGRAPSTISREIRRHGGAQQYRAAVADRRAWQRAARAKPCVLARRGRLRRVVARKLRADWSPQQIAAWLRVTFPHEPTMQVSHETIYRTLYVQARGALKTELMQHLRRGRTLRRSGPRARRGHGQGQITDAVSIAERPPSADDRALPGHWEGDLLAGTKWSQIATLVERQSRYVVLVRLRERDAASVAKALTRRLLHFPQQLRQSLTWDRGMELAQHRSITLATKMQIYFCDPRSPWQRGSNENTNGLLRQYFPKGEDLQHVTQRQLDAVARKLNTRPRQTLAWRTPADVLASTVAMTG